MKILMTGATGLLGKEIGKRLVREGHELVVVSRDRAKARRECPFPCGVVEGDLLKGPLISPELEGVEAVIHLMGESVAEGRWSEAKKKAMFDSRVKATRHLRDSVPSTVKTVLSASAIGIYGDRGDETLTESSAPGSDLLAKICVEWEKEARLFSERGARVVSLRFGVVLSRRGGALPQMVFPFRAGVGGPLGNGRQWMSWVHIDDVVGLTLFALGNERLSGSVNVVAPHPVRNKDFSKALAAVLGRPALIPTPQIGLRLLFGEKAGILTASQNVHPRKALEAGYSFRFTQLSAALKDQLEFAARGEDVFEAEQYLPFSPEELFPFFSDAKNLERITPPAMGFRIVSMSTDEITSGTLIDYRLKIRGIPAGWRTRIESWDPPRQFVDTQLKGPYRLWHHTHTFERLGPGTLMTDVVRYQLPLGWVGWMGGGSLVQRDVAGIFRFRREVIDGLYGERGRTR